MSFKAARDDISAKTIPITLQVFSSKKTLKKQITRNITCIKEQKQKENIIAVYV